MRSLSFNAPPAVRVCLVSMAATLTMAALMIAAALPGSGPAWPWLMLPASFVALCAAMLLARTNAGAVMAGAVAATAGIGLLFASAALAQGAAAPTTRSVDVGPLVAATIQLFSPLVVAIGGVVGTWVLAKLHAFLGLKQDALHRETVEQVFDRGIEYAMSKLGDKAAGGIPLDMKKEAIAIIAGYAARSGPGALRHFKKSAEDIAAMAEARLEGVLVDPVNERQQILVSSRLAQAGH